ncbi:hypothetical protein B1218_35750, partial [Pseudomonas ogarae]
MEREGGGRAQRLVWEQRLGGRKRVGLAKGMVMEMKGCNEEQGDTGVGRQAMSRQEKVIQVAEQI